MSDVVETAARAQARLLCAQGWTKEECDSFVDGRWENYVAFARATIASLRVPNDAILDAMVGCGYHKPSPYVRRECLREWTRAIDAALSEPRIESAAGAAPGATN